MKQNIKRLLTVSIVIGITIIVSIFLYHKVMDREEERCWQILSDSAKTISAEIQMKFQDNITTLGLAANAMVQENNLSRNRFHLFTSMHLQKIRYSPELMLSIRTTRFCMKTDT